jgi:5-methyltetrahydrofolate--homocysteine methyltransferase
MMRELTDELAVLRDAVATGDRPAAVESTKRLLGAGANPASIVDDALVPGITQVGEQFRDSKCFVPEVLLAARSMRASLDLVRPRFGEGGMPVAGTMVLGTVHGDLHDIGKNLVAMLVEGAGLRVVDLGVDVAPQRFADAVRQHNADVVGISALLTTTMRNIREVIAALEADGLRPRVKVLVGGAPVTADWAREVGADAFAPDAATAAIICREWTGRRPA